MHLVERLARTDADFAWLLLVQLVPAPTADPPAPPAAAVANAWAALDALRASGSRAADWGPPSDGRLTRLRPVLDALGEVPPPMVAVRRVRAEFPEMGGHGATAPVA